MFTDTHCHILSEYYDDINKIILNSINSRVDRFINAAYDEKSILEVLEISKKYNQIYATIGIHPSEASRLENIDLSIIKNNISNSKVIAIGEIGLDYHYGKEDKDNQHELFRKQLRIAEEANLPVVIHSRDATEDTIKILKEYQVKGVIHSFSGSIETAKIYLNMGFILGINGVVTFKNSHLLETVREIGIQNIILETDCPYLTPSPYRGKKNEPKNIMIIAEYLSEKLNVDIQNLSKFTNDNITRIFDI